MCTISPCVTVYRHSFRYSMKFCLFSSAVVVGLPRSSLAPIPHFTSIKVSSFFAFATASSLSKVS